jgi:hypothetical protein
MERRIRVLKQLSIQILTFMEECADVIIPANILGLFYEILGA